MTQATEVLVPTSPDEAAAAFGDGSGVTVIGGGTIVMPEITYGRLKVGKALLLGKAGLSGVSRNGGTVTIGAATPIADLVDLPPPLGPCAANVADGEIRAQATLGGNVCAGPGPDAPRGDLQGPLLALDATARSTGPGGERSEPLESFLDDRAGRLLLDVSFGEPAAGAFAALDYPHTHEYTVLAVSGARGADGAVRLAATGLADHARTLSGDPDAAASEVRLGDDALASGWYRQQVLPVLVRRVLADLEEAR
ncbi:MAG: FAD binding domain-containing protein [Thermoleophilia bacterium]|nr:FAD binding domain-containing protein [Thermoleophilia bacterium]MDH4344986.1 FAD binding domain-containing protein [Thermoleophilia bacterium]